MLVRYRVRSKLGHLAGPICLSIPLYCMSGRSHRASEGGGTQGLGHDAVERLQSPAEVEWWRVPAPQSEPPLKPLWALSLKGHLSPSCELPLGAQLIQDFWEAAWHSCLPEISQALNTGVLDCHKTCPLHLYAISLCSNLVKSPKTTPQHTLSDHLVTTTESFSSVLWVW